MSSRTVKAAGVVAPTMPPGLVTRYKAATRALILAAGGPAKVQAIIGMSLPSISRWQSDHTPDLIPGWAVLWIEFAIQEPAFTREIVGLTLHELVATEGKGSTAVTLITGVADVMSKAGTAAACVVEAVADGKITPAERRETTDKLAEVSAALGHLQRQLHGIPVAADQAESEVAP